MSTEVHGLTLAIPKAWAPDHIYRFLLPAQPQQSMLLAQSAESKEVRPNLVVGQHRSTSSPEALLDEINQARLLRDKHFKVLGRFLRGIGGTPAVVQDSMSQPLRAAPLFQREAVLPGKGGTLLMMVLTVNRREDLELQSASLFDGPATSGSSRR